ncbi:MAG: alanine racemase [Gemmatimonadetes bacterium]|nr:alanine racemase [Gemmatimonadota bacterium]MYG34816.1 alanine racemase [Gemmatimonadota bacterium]
MDRAPRFPRRRFIHLAGGAAGLIATSACASTTRSNGPGARAVSGASAPGVPLTTARTYTPDRFDPWIELDRGAWAHNVREAARLASSRPILAVVKNNAYGLGDRAVGPLLADMPEVGGIAAVRVEEALAMREEGVAKPIVVMAEGSEDEIEEMVRHDVLPSVWLDDAPRRLRNVSRRLGQPVPVHLFIDTGMNREGMPYTRARNWIEELVQSEHVDVNGTYTMFTHDLDFDREQHARFEELLGWARSRNLPLGTLHAAPSFELFHLPEAHYDMVRPGNALFGNAPGEEAREIADLRPVFSLKTRVVRVEHLEPGDSAGFNRTFMPERATWVALLPVGRTDGYPSQANGTCEVLINGRVYPVAGGVNSAHAILDIGPEKTVAVGDVATLIGPDHPAVLPHTVAERTELGFLRIIQGMNPRLPRRVV